MKNFLIVFFLAFFCVVSPVFSQADTVGSNDGVKPDVEKPLGIISKFWVAYAVVEHSLKNDNGEFKTVAKLDELNPQRLDFLSSFWWTKILRDCDARKLIDDAFTGTSGDVAKNLAEKNVNNCAYWVIYDNWDEINTTIKNAYAVETKKSNWFYKLFDQIKQ